MDRQLRELERRAQGGDADAALLLIQRTADLAGGELYINYADDPWGRQYLSSLRYIRHYPSLWPKLFDSIEVDRWVTFRKGVMKDKGKRKTIHGIPNRIYMRSYLTLPNDSREHIPLRTNVYPIDMSPESLYQFYKNLITLEECKALFDQGATVEQIRAFAAGS